MKAPLCTVCQMTFNEEHRVPMMLQCGHSFCKECLSHMFSTSADNTLVCPRCRQPSKVGNSVEGLRKNFAMLTLLHRASDDNDNNNNSNDSDDSDDDFDLNDLCGGSERNPNPMSSSSLNHHHNSNVNNSLSTSWSNCLSDLGAHSMRLQKQLGTGPRPGQDTWTAFLSSASGCRHRVVVKRVKVMDGMDLASIQSKLDNLRRASLWCHNVCGFYGSCEKDDKLCLISERYVSSVHSEMLQNEGRLTLEQILRYGADISRGVAELHAAGICCMNLRPSNILLDTKGRAVISDFGLPEILKKPQCKRLRSMQEDDAARMHSCVECTMLNPHYTAPEAWESPKKSSLNIFWDEGNGISAESDAWSFGCTLVEMCTGAVPWQGLSTEEIYKAVVKARRQPPEYASVVGVGIPRELWKIIGECLQFKPSRRPTFHAMLSIFLRNLQEVPFSPPASPDNDLSKDCETTISEPSPSSVLEFTDDVQNVLHQLVLVGDGEGVRDLLSKVSSPKSGTSIGTLLERRNAEGQTALHLACMRGHVEIVEAILEYAEADIEILDKDGDPPIVFALTAGTPGCLKALIKKGANVNAKLKDGLGPSVAHICAFHGQPECMLELLLAGADPNAIDDKGETVLHSAISKRHTDCAIVILEYGGCKSMGVLDSKDLTPLHLAVATWNVPIVKRWVEVASVKEIKSAIDIPSKRGAALCMAASLKKSHEAECRELVKILLEAGADPGAQDAEHGQTVLHLAAMANDTELVKIILEAGVDVDIRNLHNRTPLHVALDRGSKSCVGLLLESGANCNLQDDDGDNAFHVAAHTAKMVRENLDWIAAMLQKADAAIDVRNHSGKTLKDFIEALPREWITEDLMDALEHQGIDLSPTIFEIGDWVKFRRTVRVPKYGWQGAMQKSVGFVQNVPDKDHLIVSFCSGDARVLVEEVIKVIPLDRGQHVQLKPEVKEPRYGWRGQSRDSVGTVLCVDDEGILRVGFPGASRGWKADPAEMERVEEFKVGDWVRVRPSLTSAKHGLGPVTPGSIGIVLYIRPDNSLLLDFSYLQGPFHFEPEEVERVEPFKVGDRVCVRRSVAEPRYAWGGETHHSVGVISEIGSDGLLSIDIPGRPIPWHADPADMEKIEDFKVGDWVRAKPSVSSPKYGWEDVTRSSIGVVHSLEEDGDMGVAFCFRSKTFTCSVTDMEKVTPFEVGDEIHILPSITEPRLGWSRETSATSGKIARIDMDGTLNVKVACRPSLWKVAPGDAEKLSGFEVGDWVRLNPALGRPSYDWHGIGKDSFAVVHSLSDTGYLELASCFRNSRWMAHYSEVQKVPSFKVGQHVRFRPGLTSPRWGWRGASPSSRGVIIGVHTDGEVRVAFPGLTVPWRGDPADLEKEEMFEVGDWVRVRLDLQEPRNGWKLVKPGSIGIVQGITYEHEQDIGERTFLIGFCGVQERWQGLSHEIERVKAFITAELVRVKPSVKQPRFGWSGHNHNNVGTITSIDADGRLRVYTSSGSQKAWMLDPAEVEIVVEQPICIGDWVRVKPSVPTPTHQWGEVTHKSIGVVHKIDDENDLWVAFCFLERLWVCKPSEMERVRPFKIGDRVKIKRSVITPRLGWGTETYASKGVVAGVDADGKLKIKFAWRDGRLWVGDPADIELDSDNF